MRVQFAHARRAPGQLHAEQLPGVRLEIGGVAPKLILLERLGVMQVFWQNGAMLSRAIEQPATTRSQQPEPH